MIATPPWRGSSTWWEGWRTRTRDRARQNPLLPFSLRTRKLTLWPPKLPEPHLLVLASLVCTSAIPFAREVTLGRGWLGPTPPPPLPLLLSGKKLRRRLGSSCALAGWQITKMRRMRTQENKSSEHAWSARTGRMRGSGEDEGKLPFRERGRDRIMICKIFSPIAISFVFANVDHLRPRSLFSL